MFDLYICTEEKHYIHLERKAVIDLIKEGRKEMFYLPTHSTHFIYGYMIKDHSDSERKHAVATWATLSSKCSFICIIPQTG